MRENENAELIAARRVRDCCVRLLRAAPQSRDRLKWAAAFESWDDQTLLNIVKYGGMWK